LYEPIQANSPQPICPENTLPADIHDRRAQKTMERSERHC
jgi:hypothetical protein